MVRPNAELQLSSLVRVLIHICMYNIKKGRVDRHSKSQTHSRAKHPDPIFCEQGVGVRHAISNGYACTCCWFVLTRLSSQMDIHDAMTPMDIVEEMGLTEIEDKDWHIESVYSPTESFLSFYSVLFSPFAQKKQRRHRRECGYGHHMVV